MLETAVLQEDKVGFGKMKCLSLETHLRPVPSHSFPYYFQINEVCRLTAPGKKNKFT